jgi:hypothetical protein
MIFTSSDPRVEVLTSFAADHCCRRRKPFYSEAMRAVNTSRGQIGGLLYEVNRITLPLLKGRLLLSSVVKKKDRDWPGDGYFSCAEDFGLLMPGAGKATQRRFWTEQVDELFDTYSDEEKLNQIYVDFFRMRRN